MKHFLLLSIMLIIGSICSYSQSIGINTTSPHASAVLHVESVSQGLLIPRMTTLQRDAITNEVEGLLVYDITVDQFCFYNGSNWLVLNEMVKPAGADPQTVSHTGNLTVNGNFSTGNITASNIAGANITASNVTATGTITAAEYALNATGHGPVPQGGIIMWSGLVQNIPTGWALCDGASGRPNLSGRFIVGYQSSSTDYETIGNYGGAAAVALTDVNQIPRHQHTITTGGDATIDNVAGGYIKARQNGDGLISDRLTGWTGGGPEIQGAPIYDNTGQPCQWGNFPVGCNPNYGAFIGNQPSTYPALPHENRPPYYVLAYIIKL
jgi:microcystin-dependent protein